MDRSRIPGYSLITLAVFPQPCYENGLYIMYEYKLKVDGSLKWYRKIIETSDDCFKAAVYDDINIAINIANEENKSLIKNIAKLDIEEYQKNSLMLKIEKGVTIVRRKIFEEQLMLNEAIKRNANFPKASYDLVINTDNYQEIKQELEKILNYTPYVKLVRINKHNITLLLSEDNKWIKVSHNPKTAEYCYREKIARGFNYSGTEHWGKTKAGIRSILLPRANQLLQLASVKRMLDEALAAGHKVLVSGNYVFWFEEKDKVGWTIKEVKSAESDEKNEALWVNGTILSKNHGRIVVLPYIKENGEKIQGHTKNAPHDGSALPRHKNEYIELPFCVVKDDLMIGLFGELKYE